MEKTEVLIIGAGPAGAACAWGLQQAGIDFLILDKEEFPRKKPCAGWITPHVLELAQLNPSDYAGSITHFDSFEVWVKGMHFHLNTNQYAIRRGEFDDWLLQRVKTRLIKHLARTIVQEGDRYVVDGEFAARTIIGAGGTYCPVRSTFFPDQKRGKLVVAMEEEFEYSYTDPRCHLWFFQNGLPGYTWYVPKANGYVNVGIGGVEESLKNRKDSLKRQWGLFIEKLEREGLVRNHEYKPVGHSYYLRAENPTVKNGNTFLVGDALGLATLDMGEGIGPAIQSGIRAAQAVISGAGYDLSGIPMYSFPSIVGLRK